MSGPLDASTLSAHPLPVHPADGDKEDRGAVLIVGGTLEIAGASLLAGTAALRVGAGKLQMLGARHSVAALATTIPEARVIAPRRGDRGEALSKAAVGSAALVIGPGLESRTRDRRLAISLLQAAPDTPAVIDAGALPRRKAAKKFAAASGGRAVLTPHAGEMAAMLGMKKEVVAVDPLAAAREAASLFQSMVVMKGATTYVVSPDGKAWRHDGGVPGLGTSGSGDVLAGVIGGLLARGASPVTAALWGVALHAEAGARLAARGTTYGFLARELLDLLPFVLADLGAGSNAA